LIEPDNLLVVNAKPVPEEGVIILQVREIDGKVAEIKAKGERRKAKDEDFKIQEVDVTGRVIGAGAGPIVFKPLETKFIRIIL
jgi:hypothetical protein